MHRQCLSILRALFIGQVPGWQQVFAADVKSLVHSDSMHYIESNALSDLSGEFFQRLCHNAAVAMIATDAEFNIVFWNAAASALLGRDSNLVIGKPLTEVVPTDRKKLLQRLLLRTVKRLETSQFEIRLGDSVEDAKDLMVVLSPVGGDDGKVDGVAAWVIDHTHQKRLGDRLTQAEKMASLGTLASGVAHHFNNILGGVATFVDYALTTGDVTAMKRALQMTAEASSRASKITQSLLSFAKHDAHRTDLADLTEVVLTFAHLVEKPLAEKNIQLNLELQPASVVPVEANRMHQVLGNLLTNAEEAMPDGGELTLAIKPGKDEVILTFADTGCGICNKNHSMVFEPFFTTKGVHAGGEQSNPGLGLSVVHGIILEMGGEIAVESESGKGAKFVIRFSTNRPDPDILED